MTICLLFCTMFVNKLLLCVLDRLLQLFKVPADLLVLNDFRAIRLLCFMK